MKRIVITGLLVLAMLLSMTGVVAASEGSTKLTVSFWADGDLETKENLMKMVEDKFNVEIDYWYVSGPDYPMKLTTVMSSGDVPDMMEMANDVFYPFKDTGKIEDLRPYIESENLLSGTWGDANLAQYTYSDVIYAVPTVTKTFTILYNKDLFDEAGIEYPEDDWTENDLLEKARSLTTGEGVNKIYGFDWGWALHETMRGLFGNPVYDVESYSMNVLENEEFRHTMELLKQMFDEELMIYGSSTDASITNGSVAMALAWAPSVSQGSFSEQVGDAFDWDVVELPKNDEYGPWKSTARTDGWMLSSETEHKELVWEAIKYLSTDPEPVLLASQNNGIPTLLSAIDAADFIDDSVKDKNIEAIYAQIPNSVTFQTAGIWGEINSEIQLNLELYLYGDITLDEALEDIDRFGSEKLLD